MRCKKHYTDLTSSIGVCACCLRERLLSLIAAQQHLDGNRRTPENIPASFRSVSPHFNSRKSDRSTGDSVRSDDTRRNDRRPRHHHSFSDQLFHRTPEVSSKKKRIFIRLLSFQKIFRSRNRKSVDPVSKPRVSDSTFGKSCGRTNATSSSWWFSISNIVSGGLHRSKNKTVSIDGFTTADPVRRKPGGDRGMSPVRNADVMAGEEDELTESWRSTPRRTPAVRRGGSGGHVRNVSGLAFCLSPLVRASPNLQRNDVVLPEIGGPVKPHLSYTKSFCANRSRKLVDFGRANPNR